ncbi:hypothetical protein [Alkalihalobacillus deserti]|uniref:hypothetical protein n=1 Tax=Alkalihalobacillus deserti TaxID=2879466 RepID=UPI001D15419D|nr:hypothetical protein [Alkalihalobacillus deserti]
MKILIPVLFVSAWIGITVPVCLSIIFTVLKSIITKDTTGISMLIIAIITALLNGYIGIKIYEKKIDPWLEKKKKKRNFP